MNEMVIEILGRYTLTGLILWVLTILLLAVKIGCKCVQLGTVDYLNKVREKQNKKVPKKAKRMLLDIIEIVLWPYGIIKTIIRCMKWEVDMVKMVE